MYLALKTDSAQTEIVFVDSSGAIASQVLWDSGRNLADQLLTKINAALDSQGLNWPDITAVIIFRGPGSFTSLRIGVTVANTIAYTQDIPIVGTMGEAWIREGVERFKNGESDTQVTPHYGAEPNITKPKR